MEHCDNNLKAGPSHEELLSNALVNRREESWQRQLLGKEAMNGALMRGQISPRMGVIITYLALLHLAVMMCFTRHHSTPDCRIHSLPGT